MLQLRPTFSESWYRVVNLRPKLRATAQISRQYYRGERWYVVRDPAGNQFHRLSDAAYRFVGLLDGRRTVGEAWDLVGGQLEDDAPTQPEVIQILSQLYAANLIETDISPDATILLRRHKKQLQRKMQGRLMNLMFPRIPLWDPDAFLKRWLPLVRPFISKFGAVLWLLVVGLAIALLAPEWPRLKAATAEAFNISENPHYVLYGYAVFVVIKFIHELGHAFACRRFGGEVHEMGIMFLVFIPTPYVDASTAWSFPNKWARMFVGLGGMVIELFVAALLAIFWVFATPNTLPSLIACYGMLIASITTIIFNINPLLRYDGYYILSDWLEIPNLQQKSREYTLGLIKRHVFRIKPQQPLPPIRQRFWLFFYSIFSTVYRLFIGIMIIVMVAFQIPVLGMMMAIAGVITWFVVPIVKLFKYLTIEPELHRKRPRAWAFTGAVTAAIVVLVGMIQFPVRVRTEGAVEPLNREVLHARSGGFVQRVVARHGDKLKAGDVILICENDDLAAERDRLAAEVEAIRIRMLGTLDPALREIASRRLASLEERRAKTQRQIDDLTIRAIIDGELIAPRIEQMVGRFIGQGQEVATIAQYDQLLIRAALDQSDAELAMQEWRKKTLAEIRLVSDVRREFVSEEYEIIAAAVAELPDNLLSQHGGGQHQIDARDPHGRRALRPPFEMRVLLPNGNAEYVPGQRAYIRLTVDEQPLLWQGARRFWQLIQSHSNSKWL
jgi:putative peptide zinc metalloprotease protein